MLERVLERVLEMVLERAVSMLGAMDILNRGLSLGHSTCVLMSDPLLYVGGVYEKLLAG